MSQIFRYGVCTHSELSKHYHKDNAAPNFLHN